MRSPFLFRRARPPLLLMRSMLAYFQQEHPKGDDEAQQRCGRLSARLLTQQGRKDHVAGSKKDGEQHEGRIDYLGDCQFLFHLDSRSSQKVFCVYLSIFYAICQESHLKFCIF